MLHYAGLDERINKGIPEFINALAVNAAPFTMHMYPSVNHAFHSDTNDARFDQDSANLAWQRTVAFWNHYLKISTYLDYQALSPVLRSDQSTDSIPPTQFIY